MVIGTASQEVQAVSRGRRGDADDGEYLGMACMALERRYHSLAYFRFVLPKDTPFSSFLRLVDRGGSWWLGETNGHPSADNYAINSMSYLYPNGIFP